MWTPLTFGASKGKSDEMKWPYYRLQQPLAKRNCIKLLAGIGTDGMMKLVSEQPRTESYGTRAG